MLGRVEGEREKKKHSGAISSDKMTWDAWMQNAWEHFAHVTAEVCMYPLLISGQDASNKSQMPAPGQDNGERGLIQNML